MIFDMPWLCECASLTIHSDIYLLLRLFIYLIELYSIHFYALFLTIFPFISKCGSLALPTDFKTQKIMQQLVDNQKAIANWSIRMRQIDRFSLDLKDAITIMRLHWCWRRRYVTDFFCSWQMLLIDRTSNMLETVLLLKSLLAKLAQ